MPRRTRDDDASLARFKVDMGQADEEMIGLLDALLRREHPEVFDHQARLRRRVVRRLLQRRFDGLRLSREQVEEVIRVGRTAAAQRAAAGQRQTP